MTDETIPPGEPEVETAHRTANIWHALQELGLRWIVGGVASLVILSGSTAAGVAVWAASKADVGAVSQNTSAINNLRDTLSTALQRSGDIDDSQDRMIATMRVDLDSLGTRFDVIINSQDRLVVRMDRLLCRMDGMSANACDLRYR